MLEIGRYNRLEVNKVGVIGAFLASEEGEILLPTKYVPDGLAPGDTLEVFIYLDSEDRLIATTLRPKAQVGEFALLEVKETGAVGAFLDWGLEKDLLVPFREQPRPMHKGERHLVRVYLDNSGRVAASARLERYLDKKRCPLQPGTEVQLVFYEFGQLGAKAIVEGRWGGLVFKSELHGSFPVGETVRGYIAKVREDGKIDLSLRRGGAQDLSGARAGILAALREAGGFLPVGDHSPPQQIASLFRISKKSFKTAIGNLYKEGVIAITPEGLRLCDSPSPAGTRGTRPAAAKPSGQRAGRPPAQAPADNGPGQASRANQGQGGRQRLGAGTGPRGRNKK